MHQSKRVSSRLLTCVGLAVLLAACSSDNGGSGDKSPEMKPATDPSQTTTQAYTRIIDGSWTLAPGMENPNLCVKKQITEDTYIHAIRPVHPPGSHHTLLTIGTADDDCRSSVGTGFIYAAGVGSEGVVLPDGVALKLPAGSTLDLSLHIYNTGTTELSGTSGMEVLTMDAKDVVYESDSILAGPLSFTLPAHQTTTIANDCVVGADYKAFALFPHMHQLGTHFKTTLTMGGTPMVLHDGPYEFNEQFQIPIDPILDLHAGDNIHTECTFNNSTEHDVTFGESSDTEMCFSVLFRYPKQDQKVCGGAGNPFAAVPGQ